MKIITAIALLVGSVAYGQPVKLSSGVMVYEKTQPTACSVTNKSVMFINTLKGYKISQVEDITTEEGQSMGAMSLKLSLRDIGNPLNTSAAMISIQADAATVEILRDKLAQGKRIYITTESDCVQLTQGGPVATLVSDFGISYQ